MNPEDASHIPGANTAGVFEPASGGPLPEGELLFGRYRYIRELGRGGMGLVLLAHDGELGIDIALKLVPDLLVNDLEAMGELKNEVLRGMVLTHPGIVHTYGFARDASMAAIIMEFVDGGNFTDLKIAQPGGCFDVADLHPWLEQLCPVLDYAHFEVRIGHRDLKPRNLMYTRAGRIKIADFGISSTINDTVTRVSMRNASSGTPAYMSPQQVMGERTSHLDDIYALGATIYELLTGKPPFYRGQILAQVLDATPAPMNQRREELEITGKATIPPQWEETVAACLAKEPSQRPQSAGEVIFRLQQSVTEHLPTASSAASTKGLRRKTSGRVWLSATVAVLAAGAGMAYYKRQDLPPSSLPPVKIIEPPVITSAELLQSGQVAEAYRFSFQATGGASPLVWSLDSGIPSGGLTLDERGLLAGTPEEADERTFAVKVTGGDGLSDTKAFHLVILAKPEPPEPPQELEPEVVKTPAIVPVEPAAEPEPPMPAASKELPFINSLGMRFVPAGTPAVLFSIWLTRVADFRAFVAATGYDAKKDVYAVRPGERTKGFFLYPTFQYSWENPGFAQVEGRPVCGISWEDASRFCVWLTDKELKEGKLPAGFEYRLPSDAEWKASLNLQPRPPNSPKIPRFAWGTLWPPEDGFNLAGDELKDSGTTPRDWDKIDRYRDNWTRTCEVDRSKANSFGIYDTSGNLWQFCEDAADAEKQLRCMRGGSWGTSNKDELNIDAPPRLRRPDVRVTDAGFRCVIARSKLPNP